MKVIRMRGTKHSKKTAPLSIAKNGIVIRPKRTKDKETIRLLVSLSQTMLETRETKGWKWNLRTELREALEKEGKMG